MRLFLNCIMYIVCIFVNFWFLLLVKEKWTLVQKKEEKIFSPTSGYAISDCCITIKELVMCFLHQEPLKLFNKLKLILGPGPQDIPNVAKDLHSVSDEGDERNVKEELRWKGEEGDDDDEREDDEEDERESTRETALMDEITPPALNPSSSRSELQDWQSSPIRVQLGDYFSSNCWGNLRRLSQHWKCLWFHWPEFNIDDFSTPDFSIFAVVPLFSWRKLLRSLNPWAWSVELIEHTYSV